MLKLKRRDLISAVYHKESGVAKDRKALIKWSHQPGSNSGGARTQFFDGLFMGDKGMMIQEALRKIVALTSIYIPPNTFHYQPLTSFHSEMALSPLNLIVRGF